MRVAQARPQHQFRLGGFFHREAETAARRDAARQLGEHAVAIVLQHKRASISLVQRHLRIGYNRAARLLEQMEKSGVVSAMSGAGQREVLVPKRDNE